MAVGTTPLVAQDAGSGTIEDRARATECLTLAVAYEAGYERVEGQQAVAEVVLNRLRSPHFPKTVCDVVFAGSTRRTGCQFTFTCDGSLNRRLPDRVMQAARIVAEDVLDGRAPSRVPGATHYHADYVSPYWAPGLVRVTKIGAHIFYHPAGTGVAQAPDVLAQADNSGPAQPASDPASGSPRPGIRAVFAPWGLSGGAAPSGQ